MWDSVTYVEPSRRTVIHEGIDPAHIVITNAGPCNIDLLVWKTPTPSTDGPAFKMQMPPGNTRSTSGTMIAVGLSESQGMSIPHLSLFAAIAWRIVR